MTLITASIFKPFNVTYPVLPYKLDMYTHMQKWKTNIVQVGKYSQINDICGFGYLY